jgi:hypothetical protein
MHESSIRVWRVLKDLLGRSNQKGDKYGNKTKERLEYRVPSDGSLRGRRESSGRRRELGA